MLPNGKFQLLSFLLMVFLEEMIHRLPLTWSILSLVLRHVMLFHVRVNIVVKIFIELVCAFIFSGHLDWHELHINIFLNHRRIS